MRRARTAGALLLVLLGVTAPGCGHSSRQPTTRPLAATRGASPALIEIPRQTLVFRPTRDDVTVACAVFSVAASHSIAVNGVRRTERNCYIHLRQSAEGQFELPALKVQYSSEEAGAILCMSVKVWFNEVSNFYDGAIYERLEDRYALLAWCTIPPESVEDTTYRGRFGANRVATLGQFKNALSKPFTIRLNQRPLQAEWGTRSSTTARAGCARATQERSSGSCATAASGTS